MAIVWPCELSVDAYAAAGKAIEIPDVWCPDCDAALGSWGGYFRFIRHVGRCSRIWVRRGVCRSCSVTHALLPAFCLRNRLDVVDDIGPVVTAVVEGPGGVRPAAEAAGVPHTTARGWVRRLRRNAPRLATAFAALGVELGGDAPTVMRVSARGALAALRAAFDAATTGPGWLALGMWRFAAAVSGGSLLAGNTNSPYLIVGRRRFMPPVP